MKLYANLSTCSFNITIFTKHPNKFAMSTQKIGDEEITILATKASCRNITLQLLVNKTHEFYSILLPIQSEACFVYTVTITPTEEAKFPIGNTYWDSVHLNNSNYEEGVFTTQRGSSMCETEIYRSYSKQYAREKWAYIKFNGYVSKFSFDKFNHMYDCHCKLCKSGNWTSWVSNPDIGYVREVDYENSLGFFPNLKLRKEGFFFYQGKYYTPCKDNEYNRLFFMTRGNYEDERGRMRPRNPTALDKSDWEKTVGSYKEEDFARMGIIDLYKANKLSFDDVYEAQCEKLGYFLVDTQERNLHRVIAVSRLETKVISPEYLSYAIDYPSFNILLKHPLTQAEIDDNSNHIGSALRERDTGKIVEYFEGYDISKYDQVVALGWHRTNIKDAVKCPCCEDLYEIICRSDYEPLPIYLRLIENFKLWRDEVKAKQIEKNETTEL